MTNTSINITEIPSNLAEALGVEVLVAQLIISCVVLLMFLMPMLLIRRSRTGGFIGELFLGITVTCALIGIGWLPYWVGLILALFCAVMFSSKIKNWLGD